MMIGGASNNFRFGGLATGLDTDQMVRDLMRAERVPLDRLHQRKQLAEWRQFEYREIINLLRGFKDEYFNLLKSESNMLSQNAYKKYSAVSTDSTVVTAEGSSTAMAGSHSITVTNLATAAVRQSASGVTGQVEGTAAADFGAATGKSFVITVDGTHKEITIDAGITDVASLQNAVDNAVGAGKIRVEDTGGGILGFVPEAGSGVHNIKLSGGAYSALADLGFGTGANVSNRISTGDTLADIRNKMSTPFEFDGGGNMNLVINGKVFSFSHDTTLRSMMNEINSDETAQVTMQYDEINDTFKFTAKQTGVGDTLQLSETGSTFLASADVTAYTAGEDAVVTLDGQKLTRSSNTFTVEGIKYTLLKESTEAQTISLTQDVEAVYDNISNFVAKYNEMIGTINNKLGEEYDRDYLPLTAEEKEAMSEDEIEKWEKMAKTGLLRNDSTLEKIVDRMRRALYDPVQGVSKMLHNIGITTDTYKHKGKLIIDEEKLKKAIEDDPDGVMNLFCQPSDSYPTGYRTLKAEERTVRYQEEGLAYRLFDIIEDNISTFRDNDDNKGFLLEKAGITNDASEFSNMLYEEIEDYEDAIEAMYNRLIDKENNYYRRFTALEQAIFQMNSQSQWLASQFGTGG